MIDGYRRYLQWLQQIAMRRRLSQRIARGLCLLAFAVAALQLSQQSPGNQLLLPLLLALWLLLYLLICAGFSVGAPAKKGQPIRDKLRALVFGLRRHSLALTTLLLLTVSLYVTAKLLSVLARTMI